MEVIDVIFTEGNDIRKITGIEKKIDSNFLYLQTHQKEYKINLRYIIKIERKLKEGE